MSPQARNITTRPRVKRHLANLMKESLKSLTLHRNCLPDEAVFELITVPLNREWVSEGVRGGGGQNPRAALVMERHFEISGG